MSLFEPIKTIYHESLFFFLHPKTYWQQIKSGNYRGIFGFSRFFIPGLLVAFICVILGDLIFHSKNGFFWQDALVKASRKVVFLFLLLTFTIMIIRFVIKQFHFSLKMGAVKRIVTYSISPALITTVVTGLLPFLDLGGLAPWYGFILAYIGFETYFEIAHEKKFYFYFALFMAIFSLIMILTFTLNRISAHILL
jgi:hypothetical protein